MKIIADGQVVAQNVTNITIEQDEVGLPVPPSPASAFSFLSRVNTFAGYAQGVATNGLALWASESVKLAKYDMQGGLLASRMDTTQDAPTSKTQINGLFYRNEKIYAGANNYAGTALGWILEYDANTLQPLTYHFVSNAYCEGCAFYGNAWWVIYHNRKAVSKFDLNWQHVADFPLAFPISPANATSAGGYDGIAWDGDYLYLNIHEIYTEKYLDVYKWNGSGFDAVSRLARPTSKATQGLALDPLNLNTLYFAERTYGAVDAIVKSGITRTY